MKKYLIISLIVTAAFGFTGCNNDEEFSAANVNWQNALGDGTTVDDITWESIAGIPNQTWGDPVNDGSSTDTKVVTLETGKGRCIDTDTGGENEILINNTSSTYILTDGATQTLSITDITAK